MFSDYGQLKAKLSSYMFHQRFVALYDDACLLFEAAANARLRTRPQEAIVALTTVGGEVVLPTDYLLWRSVKPTPSRTRDAAMDELDYVHPAYLPELGFNNAKPVFTIEGSTFRSRPVNDAAGAVTLHYFRKIPTLTGSDANNNWLLLNHPNAYLFGLMTETSALGRNRELAELYKSRRDEAFAEITQLYALTTGATSPSMRTADYF